MKLIKFSLLQLVFLLAIFAVGTPFFAKSLIAKTLQNIFGVPVKVSAVHLKLIPLEVGVQGVRFSSAEGFREPAMIFMPEFFVQVNPWGIFHRQIHIRQIRLHIEQVTVERNGAGRINLHEWVRTMQRRQKAEGEAGAGGTGPAKAPGKPPAEKKTSPLALRIDEVILNLGKARYADYTVANPAPKEFLLNIRDAKLHDAADPLSILEQVCEMVLKKIGLAALGKGMDQVAADLQKQAGQLFEQAKGTVEGWFR